MANTTKPDILIFSDSGIGGGLKKMKEKANVHQAYFVVPGEPFRLLKQFPSARAIWIVDATIVRQEHSGLSSQVVNYVKNRGGTVILGGFFASFVRSNELDRWFRDSWGMPWRVGQYERTTVRLQDSHVGLAGSNKSSLTTSYSSKASFLQNVSPSDSLYASPLGAGGESLFADGKVRIRAETSIAFGKCGKGWLGFTGDVNNEQGTADAVLAMMNLLA
ncbi:hypothetical protein O1611_g4137 [Lasiodiplodia mahajangana]|uniref:Uncharacterized protein n=1 Tax=Lasiodiplodia mahajangana TaxID=1108764 RepID=A0ACC2JQ27_9PEZI|nr:hypothetical protein O1611_g4137 [Lasiodiplodia mahajangana]